MMKFSCVYILSIDERITNHERFQELLLMINQRGPDSASDLLPIRTKYDKTIQFKSSVLQLTGSQLHRQPSVDQISGNVLMFNGQIYRYDGHRRDPEKSDTLFLEEQLRSCKNHKQIALVFARIDGPFAIVYWSREIDCLFYGRDIFGRKSLCLLKDAQNNPIVISSVAPPFLARNGSTWEEVDCTTLSCIQFGQECEPKCTYIRWNIDKIYHKTPRCQLRSDATGDTSTVSLGPANMMSLNCDLRRPKEFDQIDHHHALDGLENRLMDAVKTYQRENDQVKCLSCRKDATKLCCVDTKVAVAFSGGIDSTLLALALDKIMDSRETIDLVTVAFKDNSPDRLSVGCAFKELRGLCPNRNWRLVLIDITALELQAERAKHISTLISPCKTVIDDSLGCACWFIGRARGRALDSRIQDEWMRDNFEDFLKYKPLYHNLTDSGWIISEYYCPASMIFVGSSIDEQLGGYGSHRSAWRDCGVLGVLDEISFLMRRLSTRNLGRDDRVYSSHGRDVKLPYLDEELVSFLNTLPVGLKMDLDEAPDVGPKKLLRQLASRWGLMNTSKRVKRALQFGTRIANLENPGEKGDQICSRLAESPT